MSNNKRTTPMITGILDLMTHKQITLELLLIGILTIEEVIIKRIEYKKMIINNLTKN